ncbi:MAG TPA: HAD-IB family hydrolase, partial [Solirubrobacterales bacterium]
LDRTLMAGSSGMAWVKASYDAGLISRSQMLSWLKEGLVFRLKGSTDATTQDAMEKVKEVLTGSSARDLERLGPQVLAEVLPRIYPQMLDEVYAHQDAGRATFIVSAAGNGVVESLAAVLGMDGGIGTRYEVDEEGDFTGRFAGPFVYGPGKVEAMEAFAAEHGIDLSTSYAYSDSLSDLPMLRAVGNPVVVNPDPPLAELARQEGWQAMRFERLGRRLVALAITVLATVGGFGASRVAARRKPPPRRFAGRRQ